MVRVEGKCPGSKNPLFAPFEFEPDSDSNSGDRFKVRDLITKLVNESVRDFHLREQDTALRALTNEEIVKGLTQGKIGRAREEQQHVDIDLAVSQALQAFEDKLFLLFVDGIEKMALDELVKLEYDSKILVIKLTALAGR